MEHTSSKRTVRPANDPHLSAHRMMRRFRSLTGVLFLAWLVVAASGGRFAAGAAAAQSDSTNFTAIVGNPIQTEEGEKPSWQGQNFYPRDLEINVGDSVTWKFDSGNEPHTVTFNSPVTATIQGFIPEIGRAHV